MPSRFSKSLMAVLLTVVLGGSAVAQGSGPANPRVALLELYTSEGCSSCPPADRWVSSLRRPTLNPDQLVVLAFHVDYWNDLGWRDRFSQHSFTERQQALVSANGLRTAYTPQLVLNGRDFRGYGGIEKQIARLHSEPAAVRLRLETKQRGTSLRITAVAESEQPLDPDSSLYVAIYENNLETTVENGENRGRRLRHDFVVRTLFRPIPITAGKATRWEQKLSLPADWKINDLGVAAFVQHNRTAEVLQATAHAVQ